VPAQVTVRLARPRDLEGVLALCAEHAAFEGAAFSLDDAGAALGRFLFGPRRRARCLVAETEEGLVGYATYALEFSTFRASRYTHMDCLFVREGYRNAGVGRRLLEAVAQAARELGCEFVEWQTPAWNEPAMRFYGRVGAVGSPKVRYVWRVERP